MQNQLIDENAKLEERIENKTVDVIKPIIAEGESEPVKITSEVANELEN
ncbi:hypothetical protein [Piscirickettsia litoralis]|nr:hypothetical protein [Piscirickettsia litoralis]